MKSEVSCGSVQFLTLIYSKNIYNITIVKQYKWNKLLKIEREKKLENAKCKSLKFKKVV